jgi:SAM-dependent methyltransferase
MSTVLDLAAYETLAAFAAVLPSPPSRVLEVGAGQGALAALLSERGYDVTALEPDPEAAAAARKRSVKVLEEGILAHEGGPYDVVLFTRSLHHMQRLRETFTHALERLEPDGLLLAEEFRHEAVSLRGAGFCYDSGELLAAAGLPVETTDHPEIDDLLQRWEADLAGHDEEHVVHTGTRIVTELQRLADVVFERETPYLWRHILRGAAATADDPRIETAADVLQRIERRRITEGTLPPVGMIVAARRRPPEDSPGEESGTAPGEEPETG